MSPSKTSDIGGRTIVVPTETPDTAQPSCRPIFFSSTFSHLLTLARLDETPIGQAHIKAKPTTEPSVESSSDNERSYRSIRRY